MKRFQSFRIILLLVVIFAAGVATGRLSAPKPPPSVQTADGRQVTTASQLEMLTKELSLDKSQFAQFKTILDEAVAQMAKLPVGSPERITAFRDNVARLRALLRPEQQTVLDRLVQESERRYRQNLRGKAGVRRP